MLDAAESVLAKYGAESATLPRIAAAAGMSPANVYRRFRDKEALMRAVFKRFTERSSAATTAQFDPEALRPIGLVTFVTNMFANMVGGHRANARLSRAAVEYSQAHWNMGFIRKARASEARSFQQMVEMLLIWRDQIRHPDPEKAIRFAFVMVACTLRELILFDRAKNFADVLPVTDEDLKRELPRVFLGYLGVE